MGQWYGNSVVSTRELSLVFYQNFRSSEIFELLKLFRCLLSTYFIYLNGKCKSDSTKYTNFLSVDKKFRRLIYQVRVVRYNIRCMHASTCCWYKVLECIVYNTAPHSLLQYCLGKGRRKNMPLLVLVLSTSTSEK